MKLCRLAVVLGLVLGAAAGWVSTVRAAMPRPGEVDREKLRGLIAELMKVHGERYAEGRDHLVRLQLIPRNYSGHVHSNL